MSLLALMALPQLASAAQGTEEPGALDALAERLEAARVEAHIPGMSIAIVQDGKVTFARGFGLADVGAEHLADVHTLFPIGSTTKAFTSTVAAIGVDEGRLQWDDPMARHLPNLGWRVKSIDPDAVCTLRDLLSHRHGFVRMSMLWMSGTLRRAEILARAARAEPLLEYRTEFRYSNVGYLAAGEAVAAAMGSTWDALVTERIFAPLGMASSTVSLSAARAAKAPLAVGYRWDDTSQRTVAVPASDLANIAPAGAIRANVTDMAQWIRCLLGRGTLNGQRLVSEARLTETWTPQISMGSGASYGMGWMLREHRGRRVVEHGGAVDGFSAQVTLLPDEGIGYVLLMNLGEASLREASIPMVLDALLGSGPDSPASKVAAAQGEAADNDTPPATKPEFFMGTYIGNFAKFRDAEFEVEAVDGRVQLTIPGQGQALLSGPDKRGRWTLDVTDHVTVSFRGDDEAPCAALIIHQGEFAFEVPRDGAHLGAAIDASRLEPYVGLYRRERGGKQVRMLIANGQLFMEDRGNWLALHAPDKSGRALLRARDDQGATFAIGPDGTAESFVFRGEAGDRLFTRMVEGEEMPSVQDILKLRGTKERSVALRRAAGVKVTGTVRQPQAGLDGVFETYARGRDCYANHMDFDAAGRLQEWTNGESAWRSNPMRGVFGVYGLELVQAELAHPQAVSGDWRRFFRPISVVRSDAMNDRKVYVMRLEKKGLPDRFYWVDAETGDVVRVQQTFLMGAQRIPLDSAFSDFREINGVRMAHRIVHENPATGRTILHVEAIESGLDLPDSLFDPGH